MYILIRCSNSEVVEAVVLAVGRDRLRVAIAGENDVREFTRSGSLWRVETGESVEFEFIAAGEAQDPFYVSSSLALTSRAAS